MKRMLPALFLLLALFAASPAAALCPENEAVPEPCPVLVMPDTVKVPLPFAGWLFPKNETPDVEVTLDPLHGTFSAEAYYPGANFWKMGLDQMTVLIDGDPRHILLVAGNPHHFVDFSEGFEAGYQMGTNWSLGGGAVAGPSTEMTGARALAVTGPGSIVINIGRDGAPIGTGGGFTIKPPPPCQDPSCTVPPIDMLKMGSIAEIEVQVTANGHFQVRGVASGAMCDEQVVCATPFQSLKPETKYKLSIFAGPAALWGPESFTLRFNLQEDGQPVQHFELSGLPVPGGLDTNPWVIEAGLLQNSNGRSVLIDDIFSLVQDWGQEDVALNLRADRFHAGAMDHPWTLVGTPSPPVTVGAGGDEYLAQASLFGLVNNNSSKRALVDYLSVFRQRLRVLLSIDVSQLAGLDNNDSVVPFISYGNAAAGGVSRVVDLFVRKLNDDYFLRSRTVNDNGTVSSTDLFQLSETSINQVGLHWIASSDTGGGTLRLTLGGTLVQELTGLANGARTAGSLSFGAHLVSMANASGSSPRVIGIDDIVAAY